jgi:hypothetical protein
MVIVFGVERIREASLRTTSETSNIKSSLNGAPLKFSHVSNNFFDVRRWTLTSGETLRASPPRSRKRVYTLKLRTRDGKRSAILNYGFGFWCETSAAPPVRCTIRIWRRSKLWPEIPAEVWQQSSSVRHVLPPGPM